MADFQCDQAEGLRRMLGMGPQQQVYTFLSAVPGRNKNHVLFNLADSLSRTGKSVLLVDATCSRDGVGCYYPRKHPSATLAEVVSTDCGMDDVFYRVPQGFDVVRLAESKNEILQGNAFSSELDLCFESITAEADLVMIDGEFNKNGSFPLAAMENSSLVLQVEDTDKSIKDAYMLIKRLSAHFGRMPFGVLVSGSGEDRSQVVFRNMEMTAARYLGVRLYSLGFVPQDEHMARAANLGRSVVDAFPMALSSFAFRRIAGSFFDMGIPEEIFEMAGA